MELLVVVVLGLLGIAAATAIGPRLGVASPLLLVIVGIIVSFLPFVPDVEVDPEWILAGVLPPLLYSASVSMPTMEFRREFRVISGLSVGLVVVSSVALGLLFSWIVPGVSLAAGIALGAIVSPTDAVATSIVKRVGVTPRIVTVLEGESLLNDATALVLLRSAIVAAGASVTFWEVVGDFVFAVAVAVVIGYVVGKVNLWVRARVTDAAVNTVISFAVPFVAAVPSEALGASGLVAAVVAGLVTGRGAARSLSPQHRFSDAQNWRTIELILEGGVFLVMGLELSAIVADLQSGARTIELGVAIALVSLAAVIVVRALYLIPALLLERNSARRAADIRSRLSSLQERFDAAGTRRARASRRGRRDQSAEARMRTESRLRRMAADIDYFTAVPLGWREGSVIVWAGMRGAVTLAAAQTLPQTAPDRSLIIFIAFLVAAGSLIIQGGTLPLLVRIVKPAGVDRQAMSRERSALAGLLAEVADDVRAQRAAKAAEARERTDTTTERRLSHGLRLEIIQAQREALLQARDEGAFSSSVLTGALEALDAEQITMELRGEHRDGP
ncbi:sodium:proton antiporter [Agromyces sp. Marseille-P2726]|uniref:cation:proton antiporter n=1 Tax=Agromyces sp. Marseille-P2726 TaxID=2709132 RepID=UPI00156E0E69|nr:sodium:proton antiporter [Agromyces sp. Marseille-P2726]